MRTRNVENAQLDFLVSALSHGNFMATDDVLAWMRKQNEEVVSNIIQTPICELQGWYYRDDRIRHDSGKFFSIDGIHIETNYRNTPQWDQPIINQPETGFLGFIVKKFNGVMHFLMQANCK